MPAYWTGEGKDKSRSGMNADLLERKMNDTRTIGFRRRHLPHWTVADRSYFVRNRLKGAIPANVVNENDQRNMLPGVLKGFTTRKCNRILERTSRSFWKAEFFNPWNRDNGKRSFAALYS